MNYLIPVFLFLSSAYLVMYGVKLWPESLRSNQQKIDKQLVNSLYIDTLNALRNFKGYRVSVYPALGEVLFWDGKDTVSSHGYSTINISKLSEDQKQHLLAEGINFSNRKTLESLKQ